MLSQQYKVRLQAGNYNDIVTVPLVFFGRQNPPDLFNPFAWLRILVSNELQLIKPYPYEVVILELGTDGPGQIAAFKRYLEVDLAVVTAVAPEHMEFFHDLEAVAREELSVQTFSKVLLVNKDLCHEKYFKLIHRSVLSYGTGKADYSLEILRFNGESYEFVIRHDGKPLIEAKHPSVSKTQLYSICAAVAAGHRFSLPEARISTGITAIKPVSGRMNTLKGVKDSTILDDTYNSSPDAAKASLDALYALRSPHKIALLGNMNELGTYSKAAHIELGEYCDPQQLEWVVTIGNDANNYLAMAAEKRGCRVKRFTNPVDAGLFIKDQIKPNTTILAKGSQNGVFAEEAVKQFLANPKNSHLLVRQSPQWLRKKNQQF